ncbi:MAG: hypothetical protein H6674_11305, partial [Dehalococcoidia bacterium]|nr:hypothetical protein [Dehalococcoidia bacterium]
MRPLIERIGGGDRATGARLVAIALAAAVVCAVLGPWANRYGSYGVDTDFLAETVSEVHQWLDGVVPIGRFRGPLLSLLLVPFGALGDGWLLPAGRALAAVASGALVLAVAAIPRTPRAKLAAAALVATNPLIVFFGASAGTETLFAALAWGALAAATPRRGDATASRRRLTAAGALASLAVLTRYNGLPLLVGVPLVAAAGGATLRTAAARATHVALIAGLVLAPWAAFTWQMRGAPLWNLNHLNIAYALHGEALGGWDTFWYGRAGELAFPTFRALADADPEALRTYVLGGPRRIVETLWVAAGVPLALAATVGVALSARRRPGAVEIGLAVAVAGLTAPLALVFANTRFFLPLVPVLALLASRAVGVDGRSRFGRCATVAV